MRDRADPDGHSGVAEVTYREACTEIHIMTTTGDVDGDAREIADELLRRLGAADLAHPGGTLHRHLRRVADALAAWDAAPDVVLAGLCHAAYGTDGFGVTLLSPNERHRLAAVIGAGAESLVYLYGSCDRSEVYPRLGEAGPVMFTDRFTGATHPATEQELRAFVEITVANELDVVRHDPHTAAEHGEALFRLFTRIRPLMSPAAWRSCEETFAARNAPDTQQPVPRHPSRPPGNDRR